MGSLRSALRANSNRECALTFGQRQIQLELSFVASLSRLCGKRNTVAFGRLTFEANQTNRCKSTARPFEPTNYLTKQKKETHKKDFLFSWWRRMGSNH